MTTEQKAKRYDEALEWMKKVYPTLTGAAKEDVEHYFPELKESESEDEIHREWILEYLYDGLRKSDKQFKGQFKSAIAWLENLGNMDIETYKNAEKEKSDFVGGGFIKCFANFLDFKEGETYWLEYVGKDNYNVRSDNLLGKTYHITPCQLYRLFTQEHCPKEDSVSDGTNAPTGYGKYVDECLNEASKHFFSEGEDKYSVADLFYAGVRCGQTWLEKQGEQKSKDKPELKESEDERIKMALCDIVRDVPYIETELRAHGLTVEKTLAYLEKQKPTSAETVLVRAGLKPYKDGNQWCILAGNNIQEGICGFGDTIDEALYQFLKEVLDLQKEQKPAEWSEDIIRKGIKEVGLTQYQINWLNNNVFPPKEEQKPVEYLSKEKVYHIVSELTNLSLSGIIPIESEGYPKIVEIKSNVLKLLDYPIEQKPAEWSEEDEKKRNLLIDILKVNHPNGYFKVNPANTLNMEAMHVEELVDWLKSLSPQPKDKQKSVGWSEEDEEMFDEALTGILLAKNRMNDTGCIGLAERFEKAYKWLESFRPRLHLKPSDVLILYKEMCRGIEHSLATEFINYLDNNKPEGKMCLSNGECEDIEKAFKENDWAKILRYAKKYQAQSEQKPEAKLTGWAARDSEHNSYLGLGLVLFRGKPRRTGDCWSGEIASQLPWNLFPDLKWEDEPIEVEVTIRKK